MPFHLPPPPCPHTQCAGDKEHIQNIAGDTPSRQLAPSQCCRQARLTPDRLSCLHCAGDKEHLQNVGGDMGVVKGPGLGSVQVGTLAMH